MRSNPFLHLHARDVLLGDAYAELADHFQRIVDGREQARFRRTNPAYSALSVNFEDICSGPLDLFLTQAWHDLLASCFTVRATGDLEGGLHRHPPGSPPGRVHNDFNPGYFPVRSAGVGSVRPSARRLCDYKTGRGSVPTTETIRVVAMLFFLANGPWGSGDAGELAVYASARQPVSGPDAVFAPVDNSLVAFACTPFSYHAFLGANKRYRNSVIMWLHAPMDEVATRYDIGHLVRWSSS
jgi:hypothetical protein